jgi:hypothetical protein
VSGIPRGLVADPNAIHGRFGLIETLHRDQAWDAFHDLARRLSIPEGTASAWFDADGRF